MTKKLIKPPANMVAEAAGTSKVLVRKVRAGERVNGPAAKRVLVANNLLEVGINNLIDEVKRVVIF